MSNTLAPTYSGSTNTPDIEPKLPPLQPDEFINLIRAIIDPSNIEFIRTDPPLFKFEWSTDAARHNMEVLSEFNFDFQAALQAQIHTPVGLGSEFRRPSVLEPLLIRHPLWPKLKGLLLHGAQIPRQPISADDRQRDLDYHLKRGNHKSASIHADKVKTNLSDDVTHGYSLPLPIAILPRLTDAALAPLGLQVQKTIDEFGKTVPKYRMTHDQSCPGPSGLSLNRRTLKDELPPCRYGRVHLRMTHYIVSLRARHPSTRILIGKFDIKSAYRRAHLDAATAMESLTTFDGLLFASLRYTFGGSAFPALWSCYSEILCDLSNDLIRCPAWDHTTLTAPIQHLLPAPLRFESPEPFAPAMEMAVDIPFNDEGLAECYLDDIPPVCVDIGQNAERCAAALPLALHILGRPVTTSEPIPRDDLLSVKKTLGEGQMAEQRVVLGWLYNTRTLRIELTSEKRLRWDADISSHLSRKSIRTEDLDSTVGRLGHVGGMLPASRHFLSRLRSAVYHAKSRNHSWIRLQAAAKDDLRLFQRLLVRAQQGISMNNIVYRKPTHLYRSDASGQGMGGYSILSGLAWRYSLPSDILDFITLNTLEFLGCLITLWIDIINGSTPPQSCLLSQTDSTSADGWLYKSNFDADRCPIHLVVARHLATLTIEAEVCLYSQWFPGSQNTVSDALSRRFDLSDADLTSLLLSSVPSQVPHGLSICPLPKEIDSWLTWLQQIARAKMESPNRRPTRQLAPGAAGSNTFEALDSKTTHSLTTSAAPSATGSSAPSSLPSEPPASVPLDLLLFQQESLRPPSRMWRRPFGLTTGLTHDSTLTEKWRSFYDANSEE